MKKKLLYILLVFILNFAFVNVVFAEGEDNMEVFITASVENTTVIAGTEVEIFVNVKSDSPVEMCRFIVETDDNLEYIGMDPIYGGGDVWQKNGDLNVSPYVQIDRSVNTTTPLTNGENVLKFTYKVNGEGKFTMKEMECSYVVGGENDDLYDGNIDEQTINFKVKKLSDDYSLSSLEVTGGELLTPITTTTSDNMYIIQLNSLNFGLDMTTTNPDYKDDIVVKDVKGNIINDEKNITFKSDGGDDSMVLQIIIADKKTYLLLVQYTQTELDNSIKSITINGEELKLEVGEYNYEHTVDSSVKSVAINVTLSDSTHFKISENSNIFNNLVFGNGNIDAYIEVEPVSDDLGAKSSFYNIVIKQEKDENNNDDDNNDSKDEEKEDEKNDNTGGTGNGNNNLNVDSDGNVTENEPTGEISMYVMGIILIVSLIGSIVLYNKNLRSYE